MAGSKRKMMTEGERRRIRALRDGGASIADIAKKTHRHKSVVYNALRLVKPAVPEPGPKPPERIYAVLHRVEGGQAKVVFKNAEAAVRYFLSISGEASLTSFVDFPQ